MVSLPQSLVFESSTKREHTGDPGDGEGEKAEGGGFPNGVIAWWEILKDTIGWHKGKIPLTSKGWLPETSCLPRGQPCSSRGCSQGDGGFGGCMLLSMHLQSARATSLPTAPATVQVGGETEAKESKQLPTTSCSVQPKGKRGGPNTEMHNSLLPYRATSP